MRRAATKADLILSANEQNKKLWDMIDSMTTEEQEGPFVFSISVKDKEAHWKRDKNLRDVLVHLWEWHQLLLNFVKANTSGDSEPFLPAPYTWKTYQDMNVGFWKKHQDTSYEDSKKMFKQSHSKVMEMIETFSDTELFEKKHFPWTGTSSLGSYCVSATASHYDWAMKKIKRQIKSLQKA